MYYFTSNQWIHKIFLKWWKKHVFFFIDDDLLDKYNKIWNVIKNKLSIKFHVMLVYDKTYIKVKVREFDGKIKTIFWAIKYQKNI